MAVDRGRTEYTLELKDQFSAPKAKIVQGISEIDQAFERLRRSGAGVATAQTQVRQASERLANSSRQRARQLSVEEAAERKLQQTLRRRLVDQRTQEIADQRGVTLKKRKAAAVTIEEAAERRLQRLQRTALISRRALELAEQRSINLSSRKARVISIEEAAERRIAATIRKRAIAERTKQLEIQRGLRTEERVARQLTVREQAEQALTRAILRRQAAERQGSVRNFAADLARERGLDPASLGLAAPNLDKVVPEQAVDRITRARARLAELRTQLDRASDGGNQLLFTFRRLIGILAVFQAARAGFGAFRQFVGDGIRFNATIEQSRLGIASVITASSTLSDEFGRALQPAEALAAAIGLSEEQIKQLRRESLTTTATFEELLDTFQTGIGPGLNAGLNLDEIRQFTVRISQAAAAIGLQQNQLAEEIRSLLSGNIQLRTTRIAAVLQITNEDIRRAREAGNLAEFLRERFEAFGVSGELATQTFTGLLNIVRGAVQELAADASFPLFEELRNILSDIFSTVVGFGPDGAVIINPEAVAAVQPIFDGILVAVRAIRDAAGEIGFEGLFAVSQTLGDILGVVGTVLAGAIEGVSAGLQDVVRLVRLVASAFGDVSGSDLQETVAQVVRLSTVLGSVSVTAAIIGAAFSLFLSPLRIAIGLAASLASNVVRIAQAVIAIPAPLLAAAALLAGLVLGFRQVAESIFGVELTIREAIDLLGLGLASAIQSAVTFGELAFAALRSSIRELFRDIVEEGEKLLLRAQLLAARATGDPEADAIANRLQTKLFAEAQRERADRKKDEQELADIRERGAAVQLEIEKEIAGIVGDAAGRTALQGDPTFLDEIEGLASGLSDAISGLLGGDIVDVEGLAAKIQEAVEKARQGAATVTPRGTPVTSEQQQQLAEAQQQLAITRQQVESRRALNDLEMQNAGQNALRTQELKNQLAELQTQVMTQQVLDQIEADRARAAINGANGAEQRAQLEAELTTLLAQQQANTDLLLQRQREITIELERQREIAQGSVAEGFSRGIDNFVEQFGSAFQAGVNIAEGALNQLASTVASTIGDLVKSTFDDSVEVDLRERLGRFLEGIGQLILQQIIQLGIANLFQSTAATQTQAAAIQLQAAASTLLFAAILLKSSGFGGAHTGGIVPAQGFNSGGPVTGARPRLAMRGHHARGFNEGGSAHPMRPQGLHPSDNVPAWLGVGEFVEPVPSVRAYGADFMEGLRRRMFDPDILRSAAGLRSMGRIRARAGRGMGYQQGGLVSDQVSQQTELQQRIASSGATGAENGGVNRAVVVSSESEFDKLVSGGGRASLFRFMRRDKGTIRSILGV